MEIDLFCIEPDSALIPRIQRNCATYPLRVKGVSAHDGVAVLVGGGPSVRDKISSIRKRRDLGQSIFALNGAAKFLNDNGIVPDYQVILDPQDFMVDYFGDARDYLLASQCHPDVLAASPKPPILWHIAMEGREEITPHHPAGDCLVGGGYTVGLCAMCLVYARGFREIHIYGYDSSSTEQGDHAYPCPIKGVDRVFDTTQDVVVTIGSKSFRTTFSLAKQAQTFPKLCADLISAGCLITVDSGGLLQAVVEENNRLNAAEAA